MSALQWLGLWLSVNLLGLLVAVRFGRLRQRDPVFGAERGEFLGVEFEPHRAHVVGVGRGDELHEEKTILVRLADAFNKVFGAVARRQALALRRWLHGVPLKGAKDSPAPDALAFAVAAHLREVNPVRVNPMCEHALPFMRWRVARWKRWMALS